MEKGVRKIAWMVILLSFAMHALAGEITLAELTQKMQTALAVVNDMSHTYSLKYRPKGSEYSNNETLIEAKMWYRKPNLAREESVLLYAGKNEKHRYVFKLEGNVYNAYELFKDGTVKNLRTRRRNGRPPGIRQSFSFAKSRNESIRTFPTQSNIRTAATSTSCDSMRRTRPPSRSMGSHGCRIR